MAKDPVAAAPATSSKPPVIVPKSGVVVQVQMAMADQPGPRSIVIQRQSDGTYTVAVEFD